MSERWVQNSRGSLSLQGDVDCFLENLRNAPAECEGDGTVVEIIDR